MGILAHLDVVPAGDGWSFEPYSGAVDGGYIYGRGTTDDKGLLVASLFAMRALKKAGYEPSARVRLVLGLEGFHARGVHGAHGFDNAEKAVELAHQALGFVWLHLQTRQMGDALNILQIK